MQKKPFYEGRLPGQVGDPYFGKVRDIYDLGDILVAVTSDRISAFDHILPFTVRNKGSVLNMIAVEMMQATEDIIPNCLVGISNPRTVIWKKCEPVKVEFVVRGYMEGSMWRDYNKGVENFWGYKLPEGIKYQQKLPELMITPTTKAPDGEHDESITHEQIVEKGLLTKEECEYLYVISTELFYRGQQIAMEHGLILVDTKYEFGWAPDGKLCLIDEIHTPDSSRYYYAGEYEKNLKTGHPQKQLSKEFVRQWLIDNGFEGKNGQRMPDVITESFISSIEDNYLLLYKELLGKELDPMQVYESSNEERNFKYIINSIPKARAKVTKPAIGIVMGSDSDLKVMKGAADFLIENRISFELGILSAHRTPLDVEKYASSAENKGLKVIIAGAGGAAHLPGMVAASTILPVVGVPVQQESSTIEIDSLLSIVQMPPGVPVATVGVNRAQNAALLALQIIALSDPALSSWLKEYKAGLKKSVEDKRKEMLKQYYFSME